MQESSGGSDNRRLNFVRYHLPWWLEDEFVVVVEDLHDSIMESLVDSEDVDEQSANQSRRAAEEATTIGLTLSAPNLPWRPCMTLSYSTQKPR